MERAEKNDKRVRAAAEVLHKAAVHYGWLSPYYTKSYQELEKTDPIGFDEFNAIVADILKAAQRWPAEQRPECRAAQWQDSDAEARS
jgi:uncharacterized protein (DUF488 family)